MRHRLHVVGALVGARAAGIGGEAAWQAGKALRDNVLNVAGAMLQAKPEDLDIRNGIVVDKVSGTERLGLDGLVLHPGAAVGGTEDEGLRLVGEAAAAVLKARKRQRVKLLFEHTAGQGSSLGWRFEHLHTLIALVDGTARVGVCLDTCHLLAAGYDWRSPSGYRRTFDAFDALVGFDRLAVMHLNDSKKPCGSRVDRHAHIGQGEIGTIAFRRLVNDPRVERLGMVIETPKQQDAPEADTFDRENLRVLRGLMRPPRRRRTIAACPHD